MLESRKRFGCDGAVPDYVSGFDVVAEFWFPLYFGVLNANNQARVHHHFRELDELLPTSAVPMSRTY